jgi:hypothetical protein
MKVAITVVSCVLAVAMVFAMAGCETYGQAGGLGAALGGGAGAIIGHQSGHALEGAAIGAVVGGLTGLIAHDIKARRAKSREETAAAYNYQPAQGEMLTFERTEVLPGTVRPGEMIESSVQYALLGTGSGIQVTESRALLRGDQVLSDLSSKGFTRQDGTWVSSQQFRLPGNLQPGQYTLLTRVNTAQSAISGRANFWVQ